MVTFNTTPADSKIKHDADSLKEIQFHRIGDYIYY